MLIFLYQNLLGIDVPFCSTDNNVLYFRRNFLWVYIFHYILYCIWPFPRMSITYVLYFFSHPYLWSFFFFYLINLLIYFWLCWVFVSVRGLSVVVASGGHSSSRWAGLSLSWPLLLGAQAPDAQAQQLWLMGLVAPRHVGSSQTRARTRFPCIDRQILNHWATREALYDLFYNECFLDCILIHVTSTMAFISLMDFVFLPFSSSF